MFLRPNLKFSSAKRCISHVHDMNIEYLRRSFEEFDFKGKTVDLKETVGLKSSAVLVPVSVRLEKNKKGHFCSQSYFTLTKRTEHLKRHKGTHIVTPCTLFEAFNMYICVCVCVCK